MNWLKIAAITVSIAVLGCVLLFSTMAQGPNEPVAGLTFPAKVVRFGGIPSKWQADKIIVVASTPDGRTGQGVIASAQAQQLGCKVGSPVRAHMAGGLMIVDALTCGEGRAAAPNR